MQNNLQLSCNNNFKYIVFVFTVTSGYVAPRTLISYEEIASKLLNEKFFLTALELHAELCEAGKELPILREFFANPNNFENSSRPEPCISMRMYLVNSKFLSSFIFIIKK